MKVNEKRICEEFSELVQIDSVSFGERRMADCIRGKLERMGFTVSEDDAGAHYGSDTGNIYGFLKGSLPGAAVLLSAHLDTVQPGIGKQAVFHGGPSGYFTSAGDTVLGADDAAGLVEILEGIRSVQESGVPHRDIEVLFPVAEEVYVKGTEVFDFSKIRAREAYVLDLSGPVGTAALRAPSLISFQVTVKGRAAHAGFAPEQGIHAIGIAAEAVSRIRQGHLDQETTLNIGTISGGQATNIVPDICVCRGEIRSYSHTKALDAAEHIREVFAASAEKAGGAAAVELSIDLTAYETRKDVPAVRNFINACERLGITPELTETFGGSDNNNFAKHGIRGIVISCGMQECHSVRERVELGDLVLGARLVAELITTQQTDVNVKKVK